MFPAVTPRHDPPRLLVAVAHPDDETFGCGSLLLRAAADGWHTVVVCATRGEEGEATPDTDLSTRTLGEVREAELRAAADLLGVADLRLLDFGDSGMEGEPPVGSLAAAPAADVVAALRAVADEVAPDVLVSLDGGDGHRDHLVMRDATVAVARERGAAAYLQCLPRSLMDRWVEHMVKVQPDLVYLSQAELGTPDDDIALTLDNEAHLAGRERAIAVHASQTSPFTGLPDDLYRAFLEQDHLVAAATGDPVS